jgi:hypothetical protein
MAAQADMRRDVQYIIEATSVLMSGLMNPSKISV